MSFFMNLKSNTSSSYQEETPQETKKKNRIKYFPLTTSENIRKKAQENIVHANTQTVRGSVPRVVLFLSKTRFFILFLPFFQGVSC